MPAISSSLISTNSLATVATIENLALPLAATEYGYSLPSGTKRFLVKSRTTGTIQLAFAVGQTSAEWLTLFPGEYLWESGISDSASLTLYFQSPLAAQTVEILSWS